MEELVNVTLYELKVNENNVMHGRLEKMNIGL